MQATQKKGKPKRCGTRFPNIVADAEKLGVERSHLYRVLTGERTGNRLRKAYDALKAAQKKQDHQTHAA